MKRKYIKPKLARIRLNPQQAIISVCTTGTVSLSQSIAGGCANDTCRIKEHGFNSGVSS